MKPIYKKIMERIESAQTKEEAKKLECILDELLLCGVITVSEFEELDAKLMEKTK